ncbi:MAG: chitinase [Pedobacter sp.]|nr:MAG: chitinase [Pedobacter sp.]
MAVNKVIMKKYFLLGIAALALMVSCQKEVPQVPDGYGAKEFVKPTAPYVSDDTFKRVAYFPAYRAIADIDTTALDHLTHVIFSFLKPRADGVLVLDASRESVKSVVDLAKRHNCKIIIALNGDNKIYTTLLSNPTTRTQLVKSIVDYTIQNQFDGVDMDWEYPNATKGNDITFGLFMQELSTELHSWHRTLSMAVTAGLYTGGIKDGINQQAIDACDFVNLMAYDGIGTDPNALGHHSTYAMTQRVLNVWLNEKNLPAKKAVLGVPAYGKTSGNTAMAFRDLLTLGADKNGSQFTTVAGATYFYNGISDIQQKYQLAKASANGIMFWELAQDAKGENSLIRAAK